MSSPAQDLPGERPRLEARLGIDLLKQGYHHDWHTADLEQLRELEARIWATARRLEPGAPEAAIARARQKIAYDDLANLLAHRARLPADPVYAPEPLRIRARLDEEKILDMARDLEPMDPGKAIARAAPIAQEHIARDRGLLPGDSAPHLETAQRQLGSVSGRLRRLAAVPEPTRQQRVHKILGDLKRLDLLDEEHRRASEMRRRLVYAGNVVEIRARLDRAAGAREELEQSLGSIYRDPERARELLSESAHRIGLEDTIQRFGKAPAAFGKLRGFHVPGLGDSPQRATALELARQGQGHASSALARRERLESELEAATSWQRVQNANRELAQVYPSREALLAELGRHMEGLELHEVRPLLRPGQAKLVQGVRRAEQQFLEPLREGAEMFRSLEASGVRLRRPGLQARAKRLNALFQHAPRHILRRLTPPQLQGVLLAAAVAKRAVKKVVAKATQV